MKTCKCGCGRPVLSPDKKGRTVSYLKGHNARGRKVSQEAIEKARATKIKNNSYAFIQTTEYREKMRAIALKGEFGNWMNGKKLPQSTRTKMSIVQKKAQSFRIGVKRSDEVVRKMSESMRGKFAKENHWNWQGGKSRVHQGLRRSADYGRWRKAVFERDDYTCQICFVRGGKLQVDHIKQFAYHPDLRLDVSNGRTLCIPCHKGTESWGRNIYNQIT